MYSTIQLQESTIAALRAAKQDGESFNSLALRLLAFGGYDISITSVPRETKVSKYAALFQCAIGQSMRLPWRGERDPRTGAYEASQAAIYNAVSRVEKRCRYEFSRRDDGKGLVVTRIR